MGIEIKHLKKYFGNVKAIDDISFSVEEGEIFGYLGPNGAGKSTTISCLMGFIFPTSGSISIFGKDAIKDRAILKKNIGYLSSDVHLYKDITGQDHLNLIQSIRGKSPFVKRLIQDFDFNPKLQVHHLSTGTKQKLGIIICLMNQPKLLLLDEPTRGLDPLLQNMVYSYILELKKNGATIFMSSHNLSEVEKLCDNVGIIKSGKLQAVETMTTLKEKRIHLIYAYFRRIPKNLNLKIPGVENVEKISGDGISFKLKGDIDPVIKELSKFNLYDLEVTHASLEDVFMEFYK